MDFIKNINEKILKIGIILSALLFSIPSIIYYIQNGTVLNFKEEYCFLLNNQDTLIQTIVYIAILISFTIFYYLIIKKNKEIFKNIKQILYFVAIVGLFFVVMIPFESSDIFYYLGIGKLQSTYNQNPYYQSIKEYVDNNNVDMSNDTVLKKGYSNYWSNTTVVYGAIWTLICRIIAGMSFGNVDIGLILFKILNLIIHIVNCYLMYKISKKKIFSIIYGLNPFVLLETIANVHNDIFIVFFILLAFYFVKNRKNLTLSVFCLACATAIKYFAILLLPVVIIYSYRDKDIKVRIIKCIQYGLIFFIFLILPYLVYIQDLQVFKGMAKQQSKITKGIYLVILEYFTKTDNLVYILSKLALTVFILIYLIKCVTLLIKKKISLRKEMQQMYLFMLAFIFLLITGFQPWYLMWLSPFIIWQKSKDIKLITQMQILTQIANSVFLIYSENYIYGVPFFFIFLTGTLICIIKNKKKSNLYRKRRVKQ